MTIRVSIIEDHVIVRAGLRMLIESQPDMEVIGESSTASDALKNQVTGWPHVILLDLDLGQENGLDYLRRLLEQFAPARVLVLTALPDTEVHMRAVSAGASGVVMKEQAPETLVKAIRSVHSGEAWLGRALTAAVLARLSRPEGEESKKDPDAEKISQLTPREREIVVLIAEGLNGSRIASQLRISEATVRNHLTSILSKLSLSNKFELAVYALNHNLGPTRKEIPQ